MIWPAYCVYCQSPGLSTEEAVRLIRKHPGCESRSDDELRVADELFLQVVREAYYQYNYGRCGHEGQCKELETLFPGLSHETADSLLGHIGAVNH